MTCEVCTANISKYKCPKCLLKYCSLDCYRNHKGEDGCKQIPTQNTNRIIENKSSPLNMSENLFSNEDYTEQTEDRVSAEKLQQLEYSVPLKEMLENPHLRTIIEELATCPNPAKKMEKLMQEPLFLEFADECLETVESDSD